MQSAGWYPDPGGQPGLFRFWDGQVWTPTVTTDPSQYFPGTRPGVTGQPGAGRPGAHSPSRTPLFIGLAVLLVTVLGIGGFLVATNADDEPGPLPPVTTTPAAPTPVPGPTGSAGPQAALDCSGGNGNYTRRESPTYTSTGVTYTGVPDWGFSFSPQYWTWLDDYSAMGAIRLDGGKHEAGIVLGGVRAESGFGDQSMAGERTLQCLEGSLSTDEPTRMGVVTTDQMTLGGMPAHRSRTEMVDETVAAPLLVTVYVLDSGQPGKYAEIITFAREGSSAIPMIDAAIASVRRI